MSKKYILIDLNQTVSRHQLEEQKEEKKRNMLIAGVSIVLLSLFIWFNLINHSFSKIISERKSRINNLKSQIQELKSDGEIGLTKKNVESLFKFDKERIFWAPKVMALANLTPPTMSITHIEFLRKKMNISAITELDDDIKEFDIVESFISKLKADKIFFSDFESIRFLNSSQDNVKGHKSFTFRIEAKLKSVSKRKKNKKN